MFPPCSQYQPKDRIAKYFFLSVKTSPRVEQSFHEIGTIEVPPLNVYVNFHGYM